MVPTMKMKKMLGMIGCVILLLVSSGCGNSKGSGVQGPEGTLPEIIDQIYEHKDPGFQVETTEIAISDADMLKRYTGLDSADSVSEAAVSEALINAQAYSLVLVRVTDAGAAEEVALAMKEGIDPNKWICVRADDLQVVACGDVVMLIMMASTYSDVVTSQEIVDAFREVCGGTLTLE